eukprot:CAMPEP_0119102386 /NCGR_PEP_ID=MMETSP1180-20130426/1153_1 /TAXON_ID=3052 ORGANISM="Chlamydomonas cf sp, Strain CCMP681" /NCGR_SAMPLE_ID=MMETSP1180 /ASSEMBLY_ACC=CAM_ASM_000741 /LENGTH=70 /DNA_ID=CAMNT_0007086667 /DNA_START=101 /DNA_END=313 /DNA_ORIENTATION=-
MNDQELTYLIKSLGVYGSVFAAICFAIVHYRSRHGNEKEGMAMQASMAYGQIARLGTLCPTGADKSQKRK